MTETVLTRLVDGIGIISFNRPDKHNAIDDETAKAWRAAFEWAASERDVRVVLLRGEGRSFSSGRDITVLGHRAGGESDFEFVRGAQDGRLFQLDLPKPVVAAIKGYVFGGSFEAVLAADFRIATNDVQLSLPEIRFGLLPDTGATAILTSLVGPSRAKNLVMTGRRIGAEEAAAWGLVDRVVDPSELDAAALELCRELAAQPPMALALAKQLVDQAWSDVIRRGIRSELVAQVALFGSADYTEARAARREGRDPRYTGR